MVVAIEDPPATLTFTSLLADQEFEIAQSPIYEGITSVAGSFAGDAVTGTGWLEQKVKLGGKGEFADRDPRRLTGAGAAPGRQRRLSSSVRVRLQRRFDMCR